MIHEHVTVALLLEIAERHDFILQLLQTGRIMWFSLRTTMYDTMEVRVDDYDIELWTRDVVERTICLANPNAWYELECAVCILRDRICQ